MDPSTWPGIEHEWRLFLEKASPLARSSPGRQRIHALGDPTAWAASAEAANLRQDETREAAELLPRNELWSALDELDDPTPSLDRLQRGSVLDTSEWHLLRGWLRASEAFRTAPPADHPLPRFLAFQSALTDQRAALHRLERILTTEGELSESASPRLAELSQELRSLRREIGQRMESLARDYSQRGLLQDDYSDIRDGRYVLPVRISAQSEVPGLVYEASASRQTVFVEPREVTEINNRLRKRQNDWIQEVHRILLELTREFSPLAAVWIAATELLSHWDSVQARAAIARHYHGLPLHCGGDRLDLRGTAHPLLWWSIEESQIQRNDLELDPSRRALLITGPNTGGKTVLLKTIGMAAVLGRTGFFFPNEKPGTVPYFEKIFTDLGDQQSIEAHISSFSGHLIRFREILSSAGPGSLVLLDELNSATDPEEGAALSRALLESLLDRGSWIVTTTHDPVLKSLGRSDPRILTAAMAFDESRRTPTYRLQLGVPGRSRALETAERLGIPAEILARARSFLSTQHREWENWVGELEQQVQSARLATQQAEELRAEAERRSDDLARQIQVLREELQSRVRLKIRQFLEQAQEGVRERIEQLRQASTEKALESARHELIRETEARGEQAGALLDSTLGVAGVSARKPRERPITTTGTEALRAGSRVRVPKWKNQGTVLEVRPDGHVRVALGNLQLNLRREDLEPIDGGKAHKREVRLQWNTEAGTDLDSSIDLRGMRLDEALSRAEKYLEAVFSSGRYVQVTLIHGLGTGALREGIRKLLHGLPFISEFRDGGTGGGGAGATLVELVRR